MNRFPSALRFVLLVLFVVGFCPVLVRADSNTFADPVSGFTVKKPDSWFFARREVIPEIRGKVQLQDEQLQKLVMKNASSPIVVVVKYSEGKEDKVTPTFQVVRRPLPDRTPSPEQLLTMTLAAMPRAYRDFSIVSPVEKTEIDGVKGAKATYRMTLQTDKEGEFDVRSTMWLLHVGKYQLTIACQGPESGPDTSEAEFNQIVNSIRFGSPI